MQPVAACSYQEKSGGPRGGRDGGRDSGREHGRDNGRGGPPVTSPVGSPAERPKLALKPRSADAPAAAEGASPAKANPFGGAKANDASKVRLLVFLCCLSLDRNRCALC